jgi:hypothetical protein
MIMKPFDGGGVAGMTMREWYAGQSLAGTLASFGVTSAPDSPNTIPALVNQSFRIADAMLAERDKEPKL